MTSEQVGFLGLGKLGLPCALALSAVRNETVYGFDIDKRIAEYVKKREVPYVEDQMDFYFEKGKVEVEESIAKLVSKCSLIFIAVQTPHEAKFEGTCPVPSETADFDYMFLKDSVRQICEEIKEQGKKDVLLVVISTVLPGTMRREVLPIISKFECDIKFAYNPFFIAMGSTIRDYLNPEFVLIGSDSETSSQRLMSFYDFIAAPKQVMKIESAELTKVAYNTFIGFKIVFANTLGEITAKVGGDVDEVSNALSAAHSRLMSSKYLYAGMGDGGGCHPRDQIAMSHLANNLKLSVNTFDWLARARDSQTYRQAQELSLLHKETGLKVTLLGEAYKKNINLTIGSPAKLLAHYLEKLEVKFEIIDPIVNPEAKAEFNTKAIYFVSCNHDLFKNLVFPIGSVVVDPWGNSVNNNQIGVTYVRKGRY